MRTSAKRSALSTKPSKLQPRKLARRCVFLLGRCSRCVLKVPSRFQGGKIRSTYVAFAQKEKIRLEESISSLKKEVEVKRAEADRTNGTKYPCLVETGCRLPNVCLDILSRLESLDNATLEIKKQSRRF